jgi:hypothetical protein
VVRYVGNSTNLISYFENPNNLACRVPNHFCFVE